MFQKANNLHSKILKELNILSYIDELIIKYNVNFNNANI
jgi:hypothetical protein